VLCVYIFADEAVVDSWLLAMMYICESLQHGATLERGCQVLSAERSSVAAETKAAPTSAVDSKTAKPTVHIWTLKTPSGPIQAKV
jgi:hypothetical protein